jgi:hypothetical protein
MSKRLSASSKADTRKASGALLQRLQSACANTAGNYEYAVLPIDRVLSRAV